MSAVTLHLAGDKLLISFDYNETIVSKLKRIPGCRWKKTLGRWEAPLANYSRIVDSLNNVIVSTAVMKRLADEAALTRKVEILKAKTYHELEDYSPKVPLMSHQKKAFELHRMLKGSGNFGEMGSGKTASAICSIHWHIETGNIENALVVCPKSVLRGWEEQIEFFSDLSFISLVGTKPERIRKLGLKKDIYLINYAGARIMEEVLLEKGFNMVITDEAHRIKNPQSKQSKACYNLADKAEWKIALTGSPVLNTALDAFGVMRFIDPTVFGESFFAFRNKYFKNVGPENSPIQIYIPQGGAEKVISDKLDTRSIRVLKDECMDLPVAVHLPNRIVYLSPQQDRVYRDLQENLAAQLSENKSIKINHVLTLMLKLNQITSGWYKDSDTGEITHFKTNPKFNALKEVVTDAGEQAIIIWAYYKEDMKLITNYYGRCQKCKESVNLVGGEKCPKCHTVIKNRCSEVQGSTKRRNAEIARFRFTPEERAKLRARFIEEGMKATEIRDELGDLLDDGSEPPQSNIFAAQVTAASEGLNLQRSTMSVFYSRNWSLKDWVQALARNHRKGQTKKVTYVNLVAQMQSGDPTVDQRIVDALTKKENLSKRINKDDIKLLTGNYKKKNREAFKDIVIEEEKKEMDRPKQEDDPSDNGEAPPEFTAPSEPPTQGGLF